MTDFEIKNRFTREAQFVAKIECDGVTPRAYKIRFAVQWAIKNHVSLCGADLSCVNLAGVDLTGIDLNWADLRNADLSYAKLRNARLTNADLRFADLRFADLNFADMTGADLPLGGGCVDH